MTDRQSTDVAATSLDTANYLAHPRDALPPSTTSATARSHANLPSSLTGPTLVGSSVGGIARHKDQLPNHHLSAAGNESPSLPPGKDAEPAEDDYYTQADLDGIISKDRNRRLVVVHGIVYDVTLFAPHHPGGPGPFVTGNGKDVSSTFDSVHGPNAKAKLKNWAVGKFLKGDRSPKRDAGVPSAAAAAAATTTTASLAPSPTAAAGVGEMSMDDIQSRIQANASALLLILFGDVYDITTFGREHPGGMRVLESHNGKECGETFMRIHGLRARNMVKRFYVSRLKNAPPCTSPLRTSAATGGARAQPSAVASPRARAESTRLLEVADLPTSSQFRYFTFACPYGLRVQPGGHIKVYSNVDREEGRFYTPYKTELASFSLCIKHYPHGRTTSYLFNLREGDEVFYEGPFPPAWSPDADPCLTDARVASTEKHVLLLGGGTGVIPLYTIARDLLQRQVAHVTLLFSVQNRDQVVLSDELGALEARYRKAGECCFSIFVVFSQSFSSASAAPPASGEAPNSLVLTRENTLYGKIDAMLLRRLPLPRTTHAVAVCGPPAFNENVARCVVDAAVCGEANVHVFE